MGCKTCGHPANVHDYNSDYKKRYECKGIRTHVKGITYNHEICKSNCKEFIPDYISVKA